MVDRRKEEAMTSSVHGSPDVSDPSPSPSPVTRPNMWLSRFVFVAVVAVAVVLPFYRVLAGADTSRLTQISAVALVVLVALGYFVRPSLSPLWLLAIPLIVTGSAVSGTNSSVRSSLLIGAVLAVNCALAPGVLARLLRDIPRAGVWITACFVASQTVSASVGLLQLAGIAVLGQSAVFSRATGLAGHPNVLGVMAGLAIVSIIGLWPHAAARRRPALIFAALINAAALVGTGSLSAMMATVIAVALIVVLKRKVILITITLVAIGAAIALFLAFTSGDAVPLFDVIGHRIGVVTGTGDGTGGAASVDIRRSTYDWAWNWVEQSPLVGVGMDPMNAPTFNGFTVVHNYLLRGWYQGGILVFIWLLLLTVAVLFRMIPAAIRNDLLAAPTAAIVLILTFGFTSSMLAQAIYWLPLLFAAALFSEVRRRNTSGYT